MGPESFPKNDDNEKQPDDKREAENAPDNEEESIGPRAGEYRDAAGVSHSTYSLRDGLDEKTLKKLEKMKGTDQDDKEEDSGEMKKAA